MAEENLQEIYVALLNEGVNVWRPVQAIVVGDEVYQIVSENEAPGDEQWEFSTGDLVRCVRKSFSGGSTGSVAVQRIVETI